MERRNWHSLELEELFDSLKTCDKGISEEESSRRLQEYGINELREESWEKEKERQQETIESIQESIAIISELQTGISDIFSQMSTNRMIEIDNEYKKDKERIERTIKDEKARAKALEKLDKEYEEKKREQQKKNAENEKVAALFQVAINTASAIVEALPNVPLSIAVGAMGATQAGLIAAQPIPEFATGVVNLQGAGTSTSDSIPARLSKGESVVTAAGTSAGSNAQIVSGMNRGESYSNANNLLEKMNNNILGLTAVMASKDFNVYMESTIDRDGLTTNVLEGESSFNNNNNRTETESRV